MKAFPARNLALVCAASVFMGCASSPPQARPSNYDADLLTSFELAPAVRAAAEGGGLHARMAFNYMRYATALGIGGDALDAVVSPSVVLHDLGPLGFQGLDGLKRFRAQQNAALQRNRSVISVMRFPSDDMTEIELCTERTDRATGAPVAYIIHARDRWKDDKVVERWHRQEMLPAGARCPEFSTPALPTASIQQ